MTAHISIVMPTLNQASFIRDSIASVLAFQNAQIEIIVYDGGSSDGTQRLLADIAQHDCRLKWFSEPDSGPASALNKALHRTKGSIVGWLNSDDLYAENAIAHAVNLFQTHPKWIMIYGHGDHIDIAGNTISRYHTRPPTANSLAQFESGCFICQPTVFFRSTMKLLLGDLDESLKTSYDFDYWIRAFKSFPDRIGFTDRLLAKSRLHASCITMSQRRLVCLESMNVISKHIGDPPAHWLISYADEQRSMNPALTTEEIRSDLHQMIHMLNPQPSEIGLKRLQSVVENYG